MSEENPRPLVLLIEDDFLVRKLLSQLIEHAVPESRVDAYASLQEFESVTATWRERTYSAAVIDCYEPGEVSRVPRVLALLQEAGMLPGLPVVLVTGSDPDDFIGVAGEYLVQWRRLLPVLQKPLTLEKLRQGILWASQRQSSPEIS